MFPLSFHDQLRMLLITAHLTFIAGVEKYRSTFLPIFLADNVPLGELDVFRKTASVFYREQIHRSQNLTAKSQIDPHPLANKSAVKLELIARLPSQRNTCQYMIII